MAAGGVGELELRVAIGFNGHVPRGLICHPDREHLVYPLGCTVVIQKLQDKQQTFLRGHTDSITSVVLSRDGEYVASGQVTSMGFRADIILWDFQKKELLARLSLHKGKIEALAFSPNSFYLVSLGGQDDGSVVVWDVAKRELICQGPASPRTAGNATIVACSSCRDSVFVTAGNETIQVWEVDILTGRMQPTLCRTGHLRRVVTCVTMSDDGTYFCAGTSSGDIVKMSTSDKVMISFGPQKHKFSLGVTALRLLNRGNSIVCTGGGIVALCVGPNYKVIKKVQVQGGVTSMTCRGQGHQFFVGTNECQIYRFNYTAFKEELIVVSHKEAIHDVVFVPGISDLFATCSKGDIRVWYTPDGRERLRIVVPNLTCHAVDITKDGFSIISGWDDSKIRAFTPKTGRGMYVIEYAHGLGVTAIAGTSDSKRIISGGGEGQVRVWKIGEKTQKLVEVLKEHTSAVSCIQIKKDDRECVTASLDGTCVIWDIVNFRRKQMVLANTMFKCVCYHPEEYQIITSGTDRKVGYWEVYDGSLVREVRASESGPINGMDITSDGPCFVTGGDDHLVKLWDYNEGTVTHVGVGHSGNITRLKICPGKKYIVSVSAGGAILVWKYPALD
ncbi:cilia- and flagella-associated protein 52 isoform X1 [Opisthocomus hoazin]|uniref:cilia- and flagella-associated protein 52 isoform X1 n=1 Tax=Opisthocomus hoazin TaxID=30419 RepID=UPI003F53C79B